MKELQKLKSKSQLIDKGVEVFVGHHKARQMGLVQASISESGFDDIL